MQQFQKLHGQLKNTKGATQNIKARMQALSSEPVVNNAGNLEQNISKFVPKQLMPTNVGHLNKVSWPFWYTMEFDFGTDPALTINTTQTQSFQVSQEAAFIFTHLYRFADEYSGSGDLGPWTIEFRDRQSSRFFNNAPIPIQMIGSKSLPAWLPTPMIILPNAFMEGTMSTHLEAGVTQATVGSGKHKFTFAGFRVRVEDAHKVLSSVFG